MVYDRNNRNMDYGQGAGSGRNAMPSSARDYAAAGEYDRGGRDAYGAGDRQDYGRREYGHAGADRYGQADRSAGGEPDGRRFEEAGRFRDDDDRQRYQQRDRGGYGRQPQGYDYDDRGFVARAGDEVRSWFGDDDAERRREADARYDDRQGGGRHDDDYRTWRDGQVSALDRDYHEYRHENRAKFEGEFTTWRTARQGQRDSLKQVKEHAEVVGSDGAHVGTVDKTRDDRILLTKSDADAGGRHHSVPSRWIATVDDKTVTLSKTAAEAKAAWEDEDRDSAMFKYGDNQRDRPRDSHDATDGGRDAQGRILNRSFSGTY